MQDRTISVKNLGPIPEFDFTFSKPGITVFSGPNGVGKSILMDAVQKAAKGKGAVPLRDQCKRGEVHAFGANITVGARCTHTGEFEVLNIDGKFNLSDLVDPRLEDPARADKARVRALISLTGVKASADLFRKHPAFENFDRVAKAGSVATEDFVEMATKIAADYQEAARAQEEEAVRETGHAAGLTPPDGLNLKAESDAAKLQAAYDAARDACTRLTQQAEQAAKSREQSDRASAVLKDLQDTELIKERDTLNEALQRSECELTDNHALIVKLTNQIDDLKRTNKQLHSDQVTMQASLATVGRQLVLVEEAKAVLDGVAITAPSEAEINLAVTARTDAAAAVERGALIRQAIKDKDKAAEHTKAASVARMKAVKYREAGRATDEVLSSCINCRHLRIASDGKAARLVCETERGPNTPFHELSDGQKYKIAVKIGADAVGEGGLLTVDQIGWEGIDERNRWELHNLAVELKVHVWALQASRDIDAPNEIVPMSFADMTAK